MNRKTVQRNPPTFFTFIFILLSTLASVYQSNALINILKPYHHLYIRTGQAFEFHCATTEPTDLLWSRKKTYESTDDLIQPNKTNGFTLIQTVGQPSGLREVVIRKNVTIASDAGIYTCRNSRKLTSFSVVVSIIVESVYSNIPRKSSAFLLLCSLQMKIKDTKINSVVKYNLPIENQAKDIQDNINLGVQKSMSAVQSAGIYLCIPRTSSYTGLSELVLSENVYIDDIGYSEDYDCEFTTYNRPNDKVHPFPHHETKKSNGYFFPITSGFVTYILFLFGFVIAIFFLIIIILIIRKKKNILRVNKFDTMTQTEPFIGTIVLDKKVNLS